MIIIIFYATFVPAVVLNGDIIASRAYGADKAARTLAAVVAEVNASFNKELLVPFDVIQGDAFQGVAGNCQTATSVVFSLQGGLISRSNGRLKTRFGLGLGAIDQKLNDVHDPSLLTGPAFVAAAAALERARRDKRQVILNSERAGLNMGANGTFGLVEHIWNRWSTEVWRRALRFEKLKDFGKLAQELGLSYQAVHKQLHARGVLVVLEALKGIGAAIEEVADDCP